MKLYGLEPLIATSGHALVLGSMPGDYSLARKEYYAKPGNSFWRIMENLLGIAARAPYPMRVEALAGAGITVWDVLHTCIRRGSLDSVIRDEQANDFTDILSIESPVTHVFFAGKKAEHSFRKLVKPQIACDHLTFLRLPSTSGANATMRFEEKLAAWQAILRANSL